MRQTSPLSEAAGVFVAAILAFIALLAWAAPALANDDPPGRVGRLAELQGPVSWYDHEQGRWAEAERNRPLTGGDRLATGADARAELRIGSTVLRLAPRTELEVLRLDDAHMQFQLHSGGLALRVRSRDIAGEIEVATAEARLRPERAGHYRIDRIDDSTYAGSWRGDLRVDDAQDLVITTGQRAELFRRGRGQGELRVDWSVLPDDDFGAWAVRDDRRDGERTASQRHVSPEMTGAEDLDHHGRWDRHPDYGAIWIPFEVRAGWAPYRHGRWAWVRPWGWTWVDEARWGFAPFHYGRWLWWGGRWAWAPGTYVARPVFAPALVAWVGGSHWNVSVNIGGGPAVGWVPLAPREVYVPWFRHSPIYHQHVNVPPPGLRHRPHVPQVPTGPIMYSNQGVPGGVTVVPKDVLVTRQPVARAVVDGGAAARAPVAPGYVPPALHGQHASPVGAPGAVVAPPPSRVQVVPGGAVPVTGAPAGPPATVSRPPPVVVQTQPSPPVMAPAAPTPLPAPSAGPTPGSAAAPVAMPAVPAAPAAGPVPPRAAERPEPSSWRGRPARGEEADATTDPRRGRDRQDSGDGRPPRGPAPVAAPVVVPQAVPAAPPAQAPSLRGTPSAAPVVSAPPRGAPETRPQRADEDRKRAPEHRSRERESTR
jgi:hypothetical protein